MTTAKKHLDWCVERAMVYAELGEWPNAWASFGSDVRKHPGTEHIVSHSLLGMAMVSGLYDTPTAFRRFISGWTVSDRVTYQ